MSFKLSCPRCKAMPDDARLEVTSGIFRARALFLSEDGFATMDAKQFDTDNEMVFCHACEETFSLGECLDDEMNDPVPPGFSPEQWQAVEKFAEKFPDDTEPTEQEVAYMAAQISDALDFILTNTNIRAKLIAAGLRQIARELG